MAHSTRHMENYIESSQPHIKLSPKPPSVAEETDTFLTVGTAKYQGARSIAQRGRGTCVGDVLQAQLGQPWSGSDKLTIKYSYGT